MNSKQLKAKIRKSKIRVGKHSPKYSDAELLRMAKAKGATVEKKRKKG
jgi:hypothetical protein